jgi:hypothetical protein
LSVDGYINRKQQFVTFCWKKGIFCGKNWNFIWWNWVRLGYIRL